MCRHALTRTALFRYAPPSLWNKPSNPFCHQSPLHSVHSIHHHSCTIHLSLSVPQIVSHCIPGLSSWTLLEPVQRFLILVPCFFVFFVCVWYFLSFLSARYNSSSYRVVSCRTSSTTLRFDRTRHCVLSIIHV